ncbi:MAG: RNA-binding protein [Sedimentisphaerales bacterium]|nr:RNA-binding protein [Sedimentisphaerales bacterium]
MNIYVGNLSRETSDEDLQQAFEAFGEVASVNIIKDRFSGETRGFGFVEMPTKSEAEAAIEGMNGQELKGNTVNVNEAKPREDRPRGGRGGGGRGGSRGGGGGGRGGSRGGGGGYGGGGGGGRGGSRGGSGGGGGGGRRY